jgi:hypothetical protein
VTWAWQAQVPFRRGAPAVLLGFALAIVRVSAALKPLAAAPQRQPRQ